jgi:hypothetical protein
MTERVVGGLTVKKASHHLHLNVKSPLGDLINCIVIESDMPLATAFQEGEHINIGSLDGFPEARHTTGVVRQVSHTLTGGALDFIHVTSVEINETEP